MIIKKVEYIKEKFNEEFSFIEDQFIRFHLNIKDARESKKLEIAAPGVYIFLKGDTVFKVGRHFINSRCFPST